MEKVTINNNIMTFRGYNYKGVKGYEKVDDNSFHIITEDGDICFFLNDVEINDVLINSFASIGLNEITSVVNDTTVSGDLTDPTFVNELMQKLQQLTVK